MEQRQQQPAPCDSFEQDTHDVHTRLPPVVATNHGERDSHSTGSTGSTERSEQTLSRTPSVRKASPVMKDAGEIMPVSKQKLAMDALQRGDYELLAMLTGGAGELENNTDSPGIDGPRAPMTPTNPHGSAPYANGQTRRDGVHQTVGSDHSSTHSGRPESAPTNRRILQGSSPATARRPVSGVVSNRFVEGNDWEHTTPRGRYMEPEDIEAIVQRTNEKLGEETRKLKQEFESRIAQLESRPAWAEQPIAAPGSAARASRELNGGQRGLVAEFDDVAKDAARDDLQKGAPREDLHNKSQSNAEVEGEPGEALQHKDAQGEWAVQEAIRGGATETVLEEAGESIILGEDPFKNSRASSHKSALDPVAADDGTQIDELTENEDQGRNEALATQVRDAQAAGSIVILDEDGVPIPMMKLEAPEVQNGGHPGKLERMDSSSWGR